MRRSLMTLYLQETWTMLHLKEAWDRGYSLAIRKYTWRLRIKDKIKMMKQREAQRITYNTRQGWRKEQWQ